MNWKSIEIPDRMKSLPRDRRGYPIPFVVHVDKEGQPYFQLDAASKVNHCMLERRCTMCGQELLGDCWLVGPYTRAYRPPGIFHDGAVHKECGTYALQVCPFLAAPSYSKMLTPEKIQNDLAEKLGGTFVGVNLPRNSTRQATFFVLVKVSRYFLQEVPGKFNLMPERPFLEEEFWKNGEKITREEALQLLP